MYQPKKENLPTCKTEKEKIGHKLDSINLSYSAVYNCEKSISFSVNCLQTKNNSFSLNHHTPDFEIFFALHNHQFGAPSFTYLKENTILKGSYINSVFDINQSTGSRVISKFQSNFQVNQEIKEYIRFSKREMSLFES